MEELRRSRKLNLDLPGCVELEHPNRFLEIRKVEDFRHTPVVPISEMRMAHYREQVENRKANKYTFVYTVDQLVNIGLFLGAILVAYYLVAYLIKANDEMMTDYYRKKLDRLKEN